MCGWFRLATVRASRPNPSRRSRLSAKGPGRTLIAPMRSTRVSRARYTSPIPPAPIAERISYGPGVGQAKGHLTSLDFAKYNTEIGVSVAIGCL